MLSNMFMGDPPATTTGSSTSRRAVTGSLLRADGRFPRRPATTTGGSKGGDKEYRSGPKEQPGHCPAPRPFIFRRARRRLESFPCSASAVARSAPAETGHDKAAKFNRPAILSPDTQGRESGRRSGVSGIDGGPAESAARGPRPYFAGSSSPRWRATPDGRSVLHPRHSARWGEDGWLGLGWPLEYGGHDRGPIDQMIFVEESHWAGVPLPLLTLNSVGPTLMALGTDEQKKRFLPGILRGEVHFSIGYTEPSAGTDLASLQDPAVRDGDEYVINGQKLFTSAIQYADYVWLAARTDPDVAKHKGLSVFIVPVDTEGSPGPRCHHRRRHHQHHLLRRRAGAGREPRRWENQGWKPSPTSSTMNGSPSAPRRAAARSRRGGAWAQEHPATVAGSSTRSGCR